MVPIIIGLIITLIIIIVAANIIQQHREKLEAEIRAKIAKQKAIIDETEEIILNLTLLPHNAGVIEILNRRCLNAAKIIKQLKPKLKYINDRLAELDAQLKLSVELASNQVAPEEAFILPDNEQQLIKVLQCIKKLRSILKSEQTKGIIDAPTFMKHDHRLDAMQLKINIESLFKRGIQAFNKEMIGSARQYFQKALQTLINHPIKNEYIEIKETEINEKLKEISDMLKNNNTKDAERKAKSAEDDLDTLFQPKKKW
tara:strand:- start:63 stop:833 length:771 start_codon:yes stop_codon:yes gene_type:complete